MQCPGQDNRYWDGEAVFEISCPHCGNILEFFKDDSQRSCKQCGHRVLNPRIDFGCAAYCSHAEQCLGSMPPELLAKQKNLFKDKLAIAVRKHLAENDALYKQATIRTELAEELSKKEQRGDMAAILAATLLLDCKAPFEILKSLQADSKMLSAIEKLLSNQTPETDEEQASADIFHDACILTGLHAEKHDDDIPELKTKSGAEMLQHK